LPVADCGSWPWTGFELQAVQAYEIAQMAQRQGKSRQDVSDTLTAARAKLVTELYEKMLKFSEMKEDEQAEP